MRARIRLSPVLPLACVVPLLLGVLACAESGEGDPARSGRDTAGAEATTYEDLLGVFTEFRELQEVVAPDGTPDYSAAAMAAQHGHLGALQQRLTAIEGASSASTWPVEQQADLLLVRAEMNGLDFYHRVMRPWSRDPGFYLQTQAGAGPTRQGRLRISELPLTLSANGVADAGNKLRAVPVVGK